MTKQLTTWYKSYLLTKSYAADFLANFSKASTDDEKAIVLLASENPLKRGNHMWYLWRFPSNWPSRDELLRRIKDSKLWNASISHIKTFEDLYNFVRNKINNPTISHIQQMVIYDVAIHLADLNGGSLKPKDFVYLHALPMKAFKVLQNNGFMSGVKLSNMIPTSSLAPLFPTLTAYDIEDSFCQLGKSIRRVQNHQKTRNIEETRIDEIVSKYIKTFKPKL